MVGSVGKATDSYSAHVIYRCPFSGSAIFLPTDGTSAYGFTKAQPRRSNTTAHRNIAQWVCACGMSLGGAARLRHSPALTDYNTSTKHFREGADVG